MMLARDMIQGQDAGTGCRDRMLRIGYTQYQYKGQDVGLRCRDRN